MIARRDIEELIEQVNGLINSGNAAGQCDEFWQDAGARLLIFVDQLVLNSENTNALIPKEYSRDNVCVLATFFNVVTYMSTVNRPFRNDSWDTHIENECGSKNQISFYELAFSRCCSMICQLLCDRFQYVQKLLIKNLFSTSHVCSLFASDIYMFTMRVIHPHRQMAMCQIIMNLCKLAPPEAVVKGAALINRIKHPIVNFENPKYQYILELS